MPRTQGSTAEPVISRDRIQKFLALPQDEKPVALQEMAIDALAIVMGSCTREAVVKAAEKALRFRPPTKSQSRNRVLAAAEKAQKSAS